MAKFSRTESTEENYDVYTCAETDRDRQTETETETETETHRDTAGEGE